MQNIVINIVFVLLMSIGAHVKAASFDCKSAKTLTEKQICKNLMLNDADVKMATTYAILRHLVPMGTRDVIQDEQVQWIKQRDRCDAQIRCLNKVYHERQQKLDAELQRIYVQGPF